MTSEDERGEEEAIDQEHVMEADKDVESVEEAEDEEPESELEDESEDRESEKIEEREDEKLPS